MSSNRRADGPDSYAHLITTTVVSFLTSLFLYAAQALAWVGCILNYRFWLASASKLPLLSLLKPHTNKTAPLRQDSAAPTPAQAAKQAAAQRLPRPKNALFTPVRRQQAVLGVQRA